MTPIGCVRYVRTKNSRTKVLLFCCICYRNGTLPLREAGWSGRSGMTLRV